MLRENDSEPDKVMCLRVPYHQSLNKEAIYLDLKIVFVCLRESHLLFCAEGSVRLSDSSEDDNPWLPD